MKPFRRIKSYFDLEELSTGSAEWGKQGGGKYARFHFCKTNNDQNTLLTWPDISYTCMSIEKYGKLPARCLHGSGRKWRKREQAKKKKN